MLNTTLLLIGLFSIFILSAFLGYKYLNQYLRNKKSKFAAARIATSDFGLYAKVENNEGEFKVIDISQSGTALHIDYLPKGFKITHKINLTFHNKSENISVVVPSEVVYVRNINSGVRMGLKFNYLIENNLVSEMLSTNSFIEEAA